MRHLAFLLSLFLTISVYAQVGTVFPDMETESLTNKFFNIPADVKGKFTIIGLAYSKKSEGSLKSWFNPMYNQFLAKSENPGLFDLSFDVNLQFIPMFSGAKRPAYKTAMKKTKKNIDPRLQPYVMFYKGTIKEYKKKLNFKGKDVPYIFVLDPEGKITYTTSGGYTSGKMQKIVDHVADTMH